MTRLFRMIDRLFWLVWLGYPFTMFREIGLIGIEQLGTPPAVCQPWLLDYSSITSLEMALLWAGFGANYVVWGIGLGLGHWVIHRAAKGRVLVTEIVWPVRAMGLLLLIWPLAGLILDNLVAWSVASLVPGQDFAPIWVPDFVVMGFGLFTIVIATVLHQAVDLARETELTI